MTRAAERLFIGQSAMSATLARLRTLFSDPILIRQGRQLVATPVAEGLIEPVRETLTMVESTLATRTTFDPTHDHRTFSIVASDYVTLVFLRPLLMSLAEEAPNVKLLIRPVVEDFPEQLRQNRLDLLILPREALPSYRDFPHSALFSDRYLCAVDKDHPEIGDTISLETFGRLPYLASSAGTIPSLGDLQLDRLGVARRTEITTSFALGLYLLRGTRLVTLVHERVGETVKESLNLRLLDPPVPLDPVTQIMLWTARNSDDPGHRWLRQRLHRLAVELFGQDPGASPSAPPG